MRTWNKKCSNKAECNNGIPLKVTNQTDSSIKKRKLGHTWDVLDTTLCDKVCQYRSVVFSGYYGFLQQYNWPPQNIVESGVKHHNPNLNNWLSVLVSFFHRFQKNIIIHICGRFYFILNNVMVVTFIQLF
jgi:hypothetical protein